MRRLITMLASALVLLAIGFTSSVAKAYNSPAGIYLYGNFDGTANWSDQNLSMMQAMEKVSDTEYKIPLTWTSATFKICWVESGNNNKYFNTTTKTNGDEELNTSSQNVASKKISNMGDDKAWFYNDGSLKGKYLYVTWENQDAACVLTIKDEGSYSASDMYLYKQDTGDSWSLFATLSDDGSQTLTATKKAGTDIQTGSCYFILSDKDLGNGQAWSAFDNNRWTTTNNGDVTITNANTTTVSKNNSGAINWVFNDADADVITFSLSSTGDTRTFGIAYTKKGQTILTAPEKIELFGQLGYSNGWSSDADKRCVLTQSGTEGENTVYTGTLKTCSGINKFRIHDGTTEYGPDVENQSNDYGYPVVFGTPFSVKQYASNDWHWEFTGDGSEYDVKAVWKGDKDFTVTISKKVETYDYTVYFMKPSSWSKAYVSFHYDTANAASAINGNIAMAAAANSYEMTQVEGNKYMYELKGVTQQPAKVSFSDGTDANKTEEFAFEDTKTYEVPELNYPANLYLYKRNGEANSWSVLATLTPDENHKYTATKTVGNDGFSVADCHLILCESNLGDEKPWGDITTALKWTPGVDKNITNAGNAEIKKNQSSGAIKWAFNDNKADVVTFAATLTSTEAGTFDISYTKKDAPDVNNPTELYIYHTENYGTPMLTLTKSTDGVYTATLDESQINSTFTKGKQYYFFISKEKKSGTGWNDFTGIRYTPGSANVDMNANESVSMTLSDANNFMFKNDGTYSKIEITANINDPAKFTFKKTKKGVIDPGTDDFVYLFGELGYSNTSWSDDYQSQCRIPLASTEGDAKIYKGTVNFKAGVNKFLLWGDNQKQYPRKEKGEYEISVGSTYYTWTSKNSVFVFKAPEAGSYDVEIKRHKANDYGITLIGKHYEDIYDGTLYLMSKNSLTTPYATLEYDGNGNYTALLWAEDCGDSLNEFFVVDKVKENATSVADYAGSIFTTTDNSNTAIESEGGDASISKNDNGFITWTKPSDAVTVNFTVDMRNSKFRIEVVKESSKYYLSGDINNWAIDTTDEGKAVLADYQFQAVKKAEAEEKFEGEAGWYVLPVSRMHGQWQIHDGKWATGDVQENEKWGNKWECTIDGHEFKNGASMNIANSDDAGLQTAKKEAVKKYINESFTPDSIPAEANLSHMGKGSNVTFYNMHLKHNYYNNASIYFNPVKNMAFIEGTPEDLYIYFYNAELQKGHDGTQKIKIVAKAENQNEVNYYYDPSFLTDIMAWVELSPEEQAANAVVRKVEPQDDGRVMTYRTRIPAGLEEPYLTQVNQDGTTVSVEHRFVFYIQGTSKINDNMRHAIVGHNFYFIYNNNLPTVVLNYLLPNESGNYTEATSTSSDIHSIKYRLLAFNYLGELEYVQKYVDTTVERPRTKKRSEARIWEYNDIVNTADYSDFKDLVASFGNTHVWNVSTTTDTSNPTPTTTYAANNANAWHKNYNLDRLWPGDVNRYVEIEVVRKDPEPEDGTEPKLIHEFYSDFVTGNGGLIGADETTNNMADDIDNNALITNKLKPGSDRNPQYKLSGTHLYVQVKAAIPTGVDNIISDDDNDAAPVYYNLQGVRVANPDKGIYIMVKGNTSKKVHF